MFELCKLSPDVLVAVEIYIYIYICIELSNFTDVLVAHEIYIYILYVSNSGNRSILGGGGEWVGYFGIANKSIVNIYRPSCTHSNTEACSARVRYSSVPYFLCSDYVYMLLPAHSSSAEQQTFNHNLLQLIAGSNVVCINFT